MGPSSLRSKRCVFAGSPEPQHLPLSGQSGFCSAIDWCPVFRDGLTRTGVSRYAVFRFFFGAPPASFSSISGISSLSRYSCCSASDPVAPAMADLTTFFLNCTGLSRPGTLNGCSRSCTCGLQSPPPSLQSRLSRLFRPKLNRHRCWRGSVFLERALSCLVLYAPLAGRTLPAGEGGCAAGWLPPSHYLNNGPAVRCRSSPEFPFRFIWVLGWSTWYLWPIKS